MWEVRSGKYGIEAVWVGIGEHVTGKQGVHFPGYVWISAFGKGVLTAIVGFFSVVLLGVLGYSWFQLVAWLSNFEDSLLWTDVFVTRL